MIYQSPIAPFGDLASLSIPQFMTRYNPDGVAADKVVHRDTFSSEALTYSSLRQKASLAAWGLKHELGVNPGDTILAIVTNSVRNHPGRDTIQYLTYEERLRSPSTRNMVARRNLRTAQHLIHQEGH